MPQKTEENGRHPLEAKAMGVLQDGRLKINIFSILWSDNNDIVIYRKYEDFKKMNRALRKKFPLESGLLRKSDKMIPKLRDVPIFRKNRNTSRFIERLRLLENYCQQLLMADEKISLCELVTAFFTPNSNDLNPHFSENSLVIMPSELREQQKEQPRTLPKPPAAEPIISQMYLCVEDYETKDTKNRPFKVKRNDHLGVLIKENSGWWLVENEEKRVAWFPAPFLKPLETEDDSDSGTESDDEGIRYYSATAYEAMSWDEVSIARGVLVEVIEKSNNGWWLIRYNGKTGFVPAMYLKPYRNCHQLEIMKNHGNFPSTSNLFKASSQLELSRPMEGRNTGETESLKQVERQKLDKRISRSLSGLPLSPTYGFHSNPAESAMRDHIKEIFHQHTRAETLQRQVPSRTTQRRDAVRRPSTASEASLEIPPRPSLQKQTTCNEDMPKENLGETGSTTCQSNSKPPRTPLIPQRPKPHEILHKCTTVTKKALKMREANTTH